MAALVALCLEHFVPPDAVLSERKLLQRCRVTRITEAKSGEGLKSRHSKKRKLTLVAEPKGAASRELRSLRLSGCRAVVTNLPLRVDLPRLLRLSRESNIIETNTNMCTVIYICELGTRRTVRRQYQKTTIKTRRISPSNYIVLYCRQRKSCRLTWRFSKWRTSRYAESAGRSSNCHIFKFLQQFKRY